MLHAVSYALMDSVNVLLIGVIVAVALLVPRGGRYGKIVSLLILGDWLGVFLLSIPTLALFHSIEDKVRAFIESPVFGVILIVTGIAGAILTWRGGDSTGLVQRLLEPLRTPSLKTMVVGFVLGVAQSITSIPFFTGLAYLATGDYSRTFSYIALFLYASLALSLPFFCAVGVGFVRAFPESPLGRAFEWARCNSDRVALWAGYLVAIALVLMGVSHL
ncbi:hypothetical protein AY498_03540 [Corynebacterium ulcerans]|uniref:hypothetical protein n=1 Tax=Corynebacterium ulcerans TaxID=65058 RepID=UPI000C809E0B|nr:hypothetical protein [Corynebacterium ulcerans]PME07499.1 hypothetical protein AY498_03540 [Corynebacterium ulcerans]